VIDHVPAVAAELDATWIGAVLARPVADVRVRRIGEGFGLASEVYAVEPIADAWRRPLAVKLCDADTARAEEIVYTRVLPRTRVPTPVFVDAAADDRVGRGVVVYELLDDVEQGDVLAGCSPTTADGIIDALADLHASWWRNAADAGLPSHTERLRRVLTDEHVDTCLTSCARLLDDDATALLRGLPARLGVVLDELLDHPATVIHGDVHLDNVMIRDDGSPVLLDWTVARHAPAAIDVARVQVEVLTGADRRADASAHVVRRHHRTLVEAGVGDYAVADLERAVHLAHLAFLPGLVRWGAGWQSGGRPARAHDLLRHALVATTDAALGR
jgi:aminoglycoside phosphotransferase (APT) family kinase protein